MNKAGGIRTEYKRNRVFFLSRAFVGSLRPHFCSRIKYSKSGYTKLTAPLCCDFRNEKDSPFEGWSFKWGALVMKWFCLDNGYSDIC